MRSRRKSRVKQKGKKLRITEAFSLFGLILAITAVWIFFTWQRLQIVWLKNQITASLKTARQLEDTNRNLKLRRAAFRSLARVTQRAEVELGMRVVEKDQLIMLDESWEKKP
jgi:cell division protein FtsL